MRLLSRLTCWFKGHDDTKVIDARRGRIALRCAHCGRETRGWTIDANEPRVRQHGDQMRHVLFNPRLATKANTLNPAPWLRGVHLGKGA